MKEVTMIVGTVKGSGPSALVIHSDCWHWCCKSAVKHFQNQQYGLTTSPGPAPGPSTRKTKCRSAWQHVTLLPPRSSFRVWGGWNWVGQGHSKPRHEVGVVVATITISYPSVVPCSPTWRSSSLRWQNSHWQRHLRSSQTLDQWFSTTLPQDIDLLQMDCRQLCHASLRSWVFY